MASPAGPSSSPTCNSSTEAPRASSEGLPVTMAAAQLDKSSINRELVLRYNSQSNSIPGVLRTSNNACSGEPLLVRKLPGSYSDKVEVSSVSASASGESAVNNVNNNSSSPPLEAPTATTPTAVPTAAAPPLIVYSKISRKSRPIPDPFLPTPELLLHLEKKRVSVTSCTVVLIYPVHGTPSSSLLKTSMTSTSTPHHETCSAKVTFS